MSIQIEHDGYEPPNPEKQLAFSVIATAVYDYKKALVNLSYRYINKNKRREWEDIKTEAHEFLTGQTRISQHWFGITGLQYFTPEHLKFSDIKTHRSYTGGKLN